MARSVHQRSEKEDAGEDNGSRQQEPGQIVNGFTLEWCRSIGQHKRSFIFIDATFITEYGNDSPRQDSSSSRQCKIHYLGVHCFQMDTERRRDERFETAREGVWRNYTQRSTPENATVLNVSQGGFSAMLRHAVAVGDAVEFSVGDLVLMGEVTHCRTEGEKWLAGVRIEHRLSLEQLARILNPYGIT